MTEQVVASHDAAMLETAPTGAPVTDSQAKALIAWCAIPDPEHAILHAIRQPTLVVSGSHDTMLPANNVYAMFKELSNAQLILYPDSGHGALFQHHETFVSHVRTFLEARPRLHEARRAPTRSDALDPRELLRRTK